MSARQDRGCSASGSGRPLVQFGTDARKADNHDAPGYDGFEPERQICQDEGADRRPDLAFLPGGHWPLNHAFDLNGVRFASLDATEVGRMDEAQQRWLFNTMKGAGPTRILFGHLPLWPFAVGAKPR